MGPIFLLVDDDDPNDLSVGLAFSIVGRAVGAINSLANRRFGW